MSKSRKPGMHTMIKIGLYLPVYGGWLPVSNSGKINKGIEPSSENEELPTYKYVKRVAIEAERIGIDSLWIPDHMLNPIKGETADSLESWTIASAIAAVTKKVNIAQTTLCEAFRYPAVTAKQAATLADISGGRFWLSIGAGWFKREYEAYGLPFYEHDDRVNRTAEAINIIKQLWKRDGVTFSGKYYSIKSGVLQPKPNPAPPIWYAGVSNASRNLVAAEADGWLMRGCSITETENNIDDMNERLRKKGRNGIEFAIPALTFIRDTDQEAEELLKKKTGGRNNLLDRTLDTGLIGSPLTVAGKIKRLDKIGINHVLLQLTPTLEELKNVEKMVEILKN